MLNKEYVHKKDKKVCADNADAGVSTRKEFVQLIEQNMIMIERLSFKLKNQPDVLSVYPRGQLVTLVRLRVGGRAKLKDIARRELIPTPNLCAMFKRLESDGMVSREIDENDRRNTWYCVTKSGAELADKVLDAFRDGIEKIFSDISITEEKKLNDAFKTINEILKKIEERK